MSIFHFFRILWVRRNLILITTLASLAAAIVVLAVVPPRYTATSRLMLDIVKPDPVTGEAMSSQFARAFVTTQVEIIKDYRVAGRAVDALNWTSSPELAAAYKADTGGSSDVGFRRWLAQRIIDNTEAKLIEGSNILEIEYTANDPETAAQIADTLRDAYQEETGSLKQVTAQKSATFFQEQATKLRGQLAEAEKKLTEFERANGVVITDEGKDAESARLAAMSQMAETPQAPAVSMPSAPVTSPSQGQLAQLDASIQSMSATLGPNHPRLQALRQQRAALAATVGQELAAARASRPVAAPRGPSVGALFSAQQRKVLEQRGKVGEAQQLAVDVSVLRDQVANAVKRTAELQQEAQSTETGLSYLGSAVPPKSPSFPNIPLIVMGAIALGLGLGVGLALLIELLRRRVRGPSDLTFEGVPMLGMVRINHPQQEKLSSGVFARLLPSRGAAG